MSIEYKVHTFVGLDNRTVAHIAVGQFVVAEFKSPHLATWVADALNEAVEKEQRLAN